MSTSNDRIYFGGSSVKTGRVRRLEASNFKELVERYIFAPVSFPMSRKEFNALSEDERNDRKDGPFICAASYEFDEGKREDDTAVATTLLILDLDDGEAVRDFFEAPDQIGEHLYPLNMAAWTTAKHTAKSPRLKIVVEVEPCHPSYHRRLVRFVRDRLGLPKDFKGIRESSVVSQPQYRPLHFKGEQFSAVIASRTNGIALSVADLPDEVEEGEELNAHVFACDRGEDFDTLGLLHLPVQGLTVEDIREPLMAINADCGYKEWIEIVSSLRAQFVEEDEAREAYELFDEWSSQGDKYRGERETLTKWKSVRPYAKGRAPITIRTLFHHATQLGGWTNTKIATKLKVSTLEWIAECTDGDELMTEGAKRIVAMPFRNEVVEEALILAWRKHLKTLTGNSIPLATLKKEISKTRRREKAEKEAKRKADNMPSWLQPVTFLSVENCFYNCATGIRLAPAAFDNMFAKELLPKDGAEVPANGKPVVMPVPYALNLMEIPRVDETCYNPLQSGEDLIFTDKATGRTFLNIYRKSDAPSPDPDHSERAFKMFRELISAFLPEPWMVDLFIDYHAFLVQFPGKKPRWSFLVQSAEGAGKGFFGKVMRAVFGPRNVRIVSPEVLKSQWNDWAQDTLYIVLEEVHLAGEIREKITNSIKQLITDDYITINKRNTHAQCDVPNFATVIAFTNYSDALHLKEAARRWCVIYSQLQSKAHIEALNNSGHFDRMEWLLTPEAAAGLRYALMTHRISDDFPVNGPAPATAARDNIIAVSKNHLQIKIEEVIEDATDPMVSTDLVFMTSLMDHVASITRDQSRVTHYLTILGYQALSHGRTLVGDTRGQVWAHMDRFKGGLADAVKMLEARTELKDFVI